MSDTLTSPEDRAELVALRESAYSTLLGTGWTVNHPPGTNEPLIDIYIFTNHPDLNCDVLVTGGLSDRQQISDEGESLGRAEMLMLVPKIRQLDIDLLRWLAAIPHQQNTWMFDGSTITNGDPPRPIFPDSDLSCFTFLPDPLHLSETLEIDGDPVQGLVVFPITMDECDFIREHDFEVFLKLIMSRPVPLILNDQRPSLIRRR